MFDQAWAENKLDMRRRERELRQYIDENLADVFAEREHGHFVDVGCGPGDLCSLVSQYGWSTIGYDAPADVSEMGAAYVFVCGKLRTNLQVDVKEIPFFELAEEPLSQKADVINFRGSIEQCLSFAMTGSHKEHHNCRLIDWDQTPVASWHGTESTLSEAAIQGMVNWCWESMKEGGRLMVAANGTKSTDGFYVETIANAARSVGLELEFSKGNLQHRWVKP